MKTNIISTCAYLIVIIFSNLAIASEPTITIFDGQYPFGGFMPQCISANGKYVCGSSYSQIGFISEWQTQNTKICDGTSGISRASAFGFISNDGIALASSRISFETGQSLSPFYGGFADMMSEDGRIVVGMTPRKVLSDFGSSHYIEYQACYWEDGVQHLLPVPTEEELGYYYLRTRARCISDDGSVILGEIVDRLYLLPMILWFRQEDGTYKMDAVCEKYFSDIKYNEGYYKEYVVFQGCALSKNGKWVAMKLRNSPEYNKPVNTPYQVALYNVDTGEIRKATIPDEIGLYDGAMLYIYYNGVANDGTIVGYYLDIYGGESAFIMYPEDMTLRRFVDEFNTIGAFADYDDNLLNRVSSITPDGRYIIGYGWKNDSYEGYVLDTMGNENTENEDTGVRDIHTEEGCIEYFNVSGQKLRTPAKGINIMRLPNGQTRKILID